MSLDEYGHACPENTPESMAWVTHHVKCSKPSLMLYMQYAGQHVNMLGDKSSITWTKVFDA